MQWFVDFDILEELDDLGFESVKVKPAGVDRLGIK